jgi:hypothetical protein
MKKDQPTAIGWSDIEYIKALPGGGETRQGWEVSLLLLHYNNTISTMCNDVKRCAII